MNVYVRELTAALAAAGVSCDVYTRTWRRGLAPVEAVEAGVRVHHIPAGPLESMPKESLVELIPAFTAGVKARMEKDEVPDLIHANYWLSGVSGHALKHELELPLVSTFHTLARVKAEACEDEPGQRARAEAQVVGCSDAILASTVDEGVQLARLYGADPARIEIVPPGVDHHVFSPGSKAAARAELGLGAGPVLLFVGRVQRLKGADVAVRAAAALEAVGDRPTLVIVGGPSGAEGEAALDELHKLVADHGLTDQVRFVPPQPHAHLAVYYRAADACLVPSRSESFGLVALEAAACGTPVVAAAVGGLRSLVDHARTGFLVEGRDPAAFAAYAGEIIENPRLASEMGHNAAAQALAYRWPITAARLRRIYADLAVRQLVECP